MSACVHAWMRECVCNVYRKCMYLCNRVMYVYVVMYAIYAGRSFNPRTDFFFSGKLHANTQRSGNKAGQVANLCKCTCITGSRYLPAFALWKPLSERLSAVCVASHDGGENSAACVHQFLFPSGENWCCNVRNAASSFRRVLPRSIEDI